MQQNWNNTVKTLAWAYLLLCFDINFGRVNLLPDAVGYMLIADMLPHIAHRQPSARLLKNFVTILTVVTAAEWVANLFNINIYIYLVSVFVTVIYAYTHFQLLTNVADIALQDNMPYHILLKRGRNAVIVSYTVAIAASNFTRNEKLIMTVVIINVICYLYTVYQLFANAADMDDRQANNIIDNMEV